jgi:putative peptide zinc metalloprotease protein
MEGRERLGSWVGQGTELGHVLDSRSGYQFVAVITQERAQDLFGVTLGAMQVRLRGQAQTSLAADQLTVLPYQRGTLPSAALGWLGGGELPVANDDKRGEKAGEEFYEVRLQLQESPDPVELVHGLKGALRIELPERSIYQRVGQSLRQLMQKRYQLG